MKTEPMAADCKFREVFESQDENAQESQGGGSKGNIPFLALCFHQGKGVTWRDRGDKHDPSHGERYAKCPYHPCGNEGNNDDRYGKGFQKDGPPSEFKKEIPEWHPRRDKKDGCQEGGMNEEFNKSCQYTHLFPQIRNGRRLAVVSHRSGTEVPNELKARIVTDSKVLNLFSSL